MLRQLIAVGPPMRLRQLIAVASLAVASGLEIPGLKTTYEIVTEGTGEPAVTKGSRVQVHATGIVAETGKKFWSTKVVGLLS